MAGRTLSQCLVDAHAKMWSDPEYDSTFGVHRVCTVGKFHGRWWYLFYCVSSNDETLKDNEGWYFLVDTGDKADAEDVCDGNAGDDQSMYFVSKKWSVPGAKRTVRRMHRDRIVHQIMES